MPILKSDLQQSDQKNRSANEPIFKNTFTEQIQSVSFSTFEWSQDIICIAFANKIQIAQINFQVNVLFYN